MLCQQLHISLISANAPGACTGVEAVLSKFTRVAPLTPRLILGGRFGGSPWSFEIVRLQLWQEYSVRNLYKFML